VQAVILQNMNGGLEAQPPQKKFKRPLHKKKERKNFILLFIYLFLFFWQNELTYPRSSFLSGKGYA
jgi:hypothetical protein